MPAIPERLQRQLTPIAPAAQDGYAASESPARAAANFDNPDPPMTPTAAIASPQRRNVAVLALAQALFMSVQGMGIAATPLAGLHAARGRREVAGDGADVPHAARHHGRHHSSLAADGGDRPARRASRSGRCSASLAGAVGMRGHVPAELPAAVRWRRCARACRRRSSGISAWPRPTPPSPPAAPRRSRWSWRAACWPGFLGPQAAKWSVDWLAPVTFAGVYLAMAAFSVAVLAADSAPAHPEADHGRARRRRPADDGDRAPAGLSRRARLLGVAATR